MNGRVHPSHPHPAEEEDMRGKDVKTSERPTPFTGWGLQVSLSFSLSLSLSRSLARALSFKTSGRPTAITGWGLGLQVLRRY